MLYFESKHFANSQACCRQQDVQDLILTARSLSDGVESLDRKDRLISVFNQRQVNECVVPLSRKQLLAVFVNRGCNYQSDQICVGDN